MIVFYLLNYAYSPTSSFSSVFGWGMEQLKDGNVSTKSIEVQVTYYA